MSQSSSQSVPSINDQYASTLSAKLDEALNKVRSDTTDNVDDEPSDTTEVADSPAPRVSRKEARARLKLRLESIPGFDRHSRKCQICKHPEIEELEEEFINWASAHWIKKEFKLHDESTIYRHARATGLDFVRRENLGMALEKIVQEVDHVDAPTVAEVLRAARTLARIDSRGQWVFPPSTEISNRQTLQELESPATHSKQTSEVISNRQT